MRTEFFAASAFFNDAISDMRDDGAMIDSMIDPMLGINMQRLQYIAKQTGSGIKLEFSKGIIAARVGIIPITDISEEGVGVNNFYVKISVVDHVNPDEHRGE